MFQPKKLSGKTGRFPAQSVQLAGSSWKRAVYSSTVVFLAKEL
jgi:hypothetical protein